jgi:hypothetical protein
LANCGETFALDVRKEGSLGRIEHTYRRLDKEGSFHTRWSQDGNEVKV